MGERERLLIASLPSNQTTIFHGCIVLGSTHMSEPILDHCMLLSKRFLGMTHHRRDFCRTGAFISLCGSTILSRPLAPWRRSLRVPLPQEVRLDLADITWRVSLLGCKQTQSRHAPPLAPPVLSR